MPDNQLIIKHLICCKRRIRTFTRRLALAQSWWSTPVSNTSTAGSMLRLFLNPHPPRQEGLAASFNISQCLLLFVLGFDLFGMVLYDVKIMPNFLTQN